MSVAHLPTSGQQHADKGNTGFSRMIFSNMVYDMVHDMVHDMAHGMIDKMADGMGMLVDMLDGGVHKFLT